MIKFLIIAMFCAPGWLMGGRVVVNEPQHHPTPTLTPTNTAVPTPQPTATNTAVPTPSPTPDCWSDYDRCLLETLNSLRSQYGYPSLVLNAPLSACALSHSQRMAREGYISHDGFPSPDLCVQAAAAGQNVGVASGAKSAAIQAITASMMREPWSPGCTGNHACNVLSPLFHQVGIGIYESGGVTWITETFIS